MAEFNYAHLTEQQHARSRANAAIQEHILAGTLTPERLQEIRNRYFEEVDGLDVPARIHDAMEMTVMLLGDCTDEEITVYLATGKMPERDVREQRLKELEEEVARGRSE
jgi:hypothetical protein